MSFIFIVPDVQAMGRRSVFKGLNQEEIREQEEARVLVLDGASRIPQKLIDRGIERYGKIHLEKFLANLPKIQVEYLGGRISVGKGPQGESRYGGSNFSKQRRVRLSSRTLSETLNTEMFSVFCLHEALEALGYSDEFYQLSFGMYLVLKIDPTTSRRLVDFWNERPNTIPSDTQLLALRLSNPLVGGGGASGVGKGGDTIVLRVRELILKRFFRWLAEQNFTPELAELETLRFVTRLNWIHIEVSVVFPPQSFELCSVDSIMFHEKGDPTQSNYQILLYRNTFEVIFGFNDMAGSPSCKAALERTIDVLFQKTRELDPHADESP